MAFQSFFCFLTNKEMPDEINTHRKRQKHMKYVPYDYITSKWRIQILNIFYLKSYTINCSTMLPIFK